MNSPSEEKEVHQFDKIGNDYLSWLYTALDLLKSADVLKRDNIQKNFPNGIEPEEAHHIPPYIGSWTELMLCAFSIECLLKSLWVKKGNKLAENGHYVALIKPENHDLVEMMRKVGVPFQEHHAEALHRLSVITKAVARYPIARNWKATRFRKWHDGAYSPDSWSSGDQCIIEACIDWLLEEVQK